MMTHAYDEIYLPNAKTNLAVMFDYAVNDCDYDIDWFAELFIKSGKAKQFERGNPAILTGMSGVELARSIIGQIYKENLNIIATQPMEKSAEYWAGWALADFQWYSAYPFRDIFEKVKMSDIVDMYPIFHEMDIHQFYDAMFDRMDSILLETKLKRFREARGLSQASLAEESGVQLRSIQMYEQRNNDIDKAQAKTLYKLSLALGCSIEDLLEKPNI
ncbi:MAG: helix-turn-helix domain-containing protein [Ruminococcus sp.]